MTAFTTTPTLANLPASDSRSRVSELMKSLQDEICRGLEEVDGQAKFIEDSWQRPEGGGGRSRVLREGAIFEQAGVNFSEVWGKELPPSIAKQRPRLPVINFTPREPRWSYILAILIFPRFTSIIAILKQVQFGGLAVVPI
jgi:hypothetical protein